MDLATIVITASTIIIILQIVLIVLFVTSKNVVQKPEAPGVVPVISDNKDFRKRRDDNRFNRRPPVDQRQKPLAPAPAVASPLPGDPVERSLRDINLRLKNAERDQENARQKIRDVIQTPQNPSKRFDQNNRPNRGRNDDFRGRDRNRDRNNRPQGNQFRERDQNQGPEMERAPIKQSAPPVIRPGNLPVSAPVPPVQEPAPLAQIPVVSRPVAPKEPVAIVPENTEIFHGRKVLVRRRILTAEEEAQAAKAAPGAAEPVASQPGIGEMAVQTPQPDSRQETPAADNPASSGNSAGQGEPQNIHFGR